MQKYCTNCGERLDDKANFCNRCGAPAHENHYTYMPAEKDEKEKTFRDYVDDQVEEIKERAQRRERGRIEREGEVTYSGRRAFIVLVVFILLAILVGYLCN